MTYIPLEPVSPTSSMIAEVGYARKTRTLRVVFHNGAIYDYPMFTERDWAAFLEAESKGQHFHRAIKPTFAHRRVEARELQKPCCDHPERDTCDDSCLPCDPTCCPGLTSAQRRQRLSALAGGLDRGRQLMESVRQGAPPTTEPDNTCAHVNKEATADGSYVVCADCKADLSPPVAAAEEEPEDEGELPALVCSACHIIYSPTAFNKGDPCERDGCNDGVLG